MQKQYTWYVYSIRCTAKCLVFSTSTKQNKKIENPACKPTPQLLWIVYIPSCTTQFVVSEYTKHIEGCVVWRIQQNIQEQYGSVCQYDLRNISVSNRHCLYSSINLNDLFHFSCKLICIIILKALCVISVYDTTVRAMRQSLFLSFSPPMLRLN